MYQLLSIVFCFTETAVSFKTIPVYFPQEPIIRVQILFLKTRVIVDFMLPVIFWSLKDTATLFFSNFIFYTSRLLFCSVLFYEYLTIFVI